MCMLEDLKAVNLMVKAHLPFLEVISMLENSRMMLLMDMEFILGYQEIDMKVISKTD